MKTKFNAKSFFDVSTEADEALKRSIGAVGQGGTLSYVREVASMYIYYAMMHLLAYRNPTVSEENPTPELTETVAYSGALQAFEEFVNKAHLLACIQSSFAQDARGLSRACGWKQGQEDWTAAAIAENEWLGDHVECESLEECVEARDRLEFLWRSMELRASEESPVGLALRDTFRSKLDEVDQELKQADMFTSYTAPAVEWTDKEFWWRGGD